MLLGLVLLSIGAAIALRLSHLLLPLSLGIVVANGVDGPEHERIRNLIKGFEEPLFIVFFVLAGAHLPVAAAENLALLAAAVVYLACRFAGKYGGVYLTASALRLDPPTRRYLGLCFPSQGALAMGLILAFRGSPAVQQLPAAASQPIEAAVSVILISVLLSQLAGPLLIDLALRRGNAQPQAGRGEIDRRGQKLSHKSAKRPSPSRFAGAAGDGRVRAVLPFEPPAGGEAAGDGVADLAALAGIRAQVGLGAHAPAALPAQPAGGDKGGNVGEAGVAIALQQHAAAFRHHRQLGQREDQQPAVAADHRHAVVLRRRPAAGRRRARFRPAPARPCRCVSVPAPRFPRR